MIVSAEALARIFLVLLYVPVILVCYRWLIPRLSPSCKILATGMLLAQGLMILVSLELRAPSLEVWSLWHLNHERNIPSSFASAQLMLVCVVALATAWRARKQPSWQRVYLAALGLFFLYLAWEEFNGVRRRVFGGDWELYYAAFGIIIVVATLIVAARSPRRAWVWHACLLVGLAMSAFGALGIEQVYNIEICDTSIRTQGERCLRYFYEEPLEFLGIWLTLVAVLGQFCAAAPRPHLRTQALFYGLPALFAIVMHGPYTIWEFEYRFLAPRAAIEYESGVALRAYEIERGKAGFSLQLFAEVSEWMQYSGIGYSLHLVDQASGASLAGVDDSANRLQSFVGRGREGGSEFYKQTIELELPQEAAVNRAYWLVLTVWREEGDDYLPQRIVSSDRALLTETQLILDELLFHAETSAAAIAPLAAFDGGLTLGKVDLPESAQAGAALTIAFEWRAESDGDEEYVQFLHLGHEESGEWQVYDQQPLGARLPTRLWYSGLVDSETWEAPLPADLAPGRYAVFTGLYRKSDRKRLPAKDADGKPFVDARVPLGFMIIEGP